jgi:hypothetical protein
LGQWFDFLVLDLGREYLPGGFDTYLKLLADAAFYGVRTSREIVYVHAGLDIKGIYREEFRALKSMIEILADLTVNPGKDPRLPAGRLAAEYEEIKAGLVASDKALATEMEESIAGMVEAATAAETPGDVYGELYALLQRLVAETPKGFYRIEKLNRVLQGLRSAGVDSVALADITDLDDLHLREKLPAILGPPSREPYRVRPLRAPSVQTVRLFVEKQDQLASAKAQTRLLEQRLEEVNRLLRPLRDRVDEYSSARKDKVDQLEGLLLEIETLRAEYEEKIAELEKAGVSATESSVSAVPETPPDLSLPAADADYMTLRRKLEERTEELRIAMGQFERARDAAFRLTVELEKAHDQLTEQKQEYLYYVSILIAVACLGLAVVLVVSLVRQKH